MTFSARSLTLLFLAMTRFSIAAPTESAGAVAADGAHDFDFLFATFHVANRVLEKRLVGSTEWTTFEATNTARPLLGGLGNIDEYRPKTWRPGYVGSALRLFNPKTKRWSIYWMDSKRGVIDPPVIGAFRDNVGIFEGEDEWGGRPIRVRFTWTRLSPNAARWEQAFSADEGKTWETNWIMEMTRNGAARQGGSTSTTSLNSTEGARDFDFLLGESRIVHRILGSQSNPSEEQTGFEEIAFGSPILDGLGVINEFRPQKEKPGYRRVALQLFNPVAQTWSLVSADSQRGVLEPALAGSFHGQVGVFEGRRTYQGNLVTVRCRYTRLGQNFGQAEQAFSVDQGKTWETNETIEFSSPSQNSAGNEESPRDLNEAGKKSERTAAPLRSAPLAKRERSRVVELRHYTLKPGRREDLIRLFETYFVESQEDCGASVMGHFRERHHSDRFIWLRGFAQMETRLKALEGFYSGPIWKSHRSEANDTMLDSDNVLLLRPLRPESAFQLDLAARPAINTPEGEGGLICATLYYFSHPVDEQFTAYFDAEVAPLLRQNGANLLSELVTEPAKNNFPKLPVRENENVMMWVASFRDLTAYDAFRSALEKDPRWNGRVRPALAQHVSKTEVLELLPCRRSRLRHRASDIKDTSSKGEDRPDSSFF